MKSLIERLALALMVAVLCVHGAQPQDEAAPPAEEPRPTFPGEVDLVTFTSSSTARHFANLLGPERLERARGQMVAASIGPETSRNRCDSLLL